METIPRFYLEGLNVEQGIFSLDRRAEKSVYIPP